MAFLTVVDVILRFMRHKKTPNAFNLPIDNPFVGSYERTLCLTNDGKLLYVITYNVIWANQRTEAFVYRWLHIMQRLTLRVFPHASEHRTSFQAFCLYVN